MSNPTRTELQTEQSKRVEVIHFWGVRFWTSGSKQKSETKGSYSQADVS